MDKLVAGDVGEDAADDQSKASWVGTELSSPVTWSMERDKVAFLASRVHKGRDKTGIMQPNRRPIP